MDEIFYALLRVSEDKLSAEKLGTTAAAHEWHNERLSDKSAPSSDPSAPRPEYIIGSKGGLKEAVERLMLQKDVKPAGKSSIVVAEMVASASSQYFLNGKDGIGFSAWDTERVEAWRKAALKWLRKTFGDRIVLLIYHADETAPHFHFYVVPLVQHKSKHAWTPNGRAKRIKDGDWKIGSRNYFTAKNLIKWQDGYGQALQPLGIKRGERGSRAKHREMRHAQRDLQQQAKLLRARNEDLEKMSDLVHNLMGEAEDETKQAREKQRQLEVDTANLELQKKEFQIALAAFDRSRNELLAAVKNSNERRKINEEEKSRIEEERKAIERQLSELRAERDKLRSIPVRELACKLGFAIDEYGNFSAEVPNDLVKSCPFKHRIDFTGEKFGVYIEKYRDAGKFEWEKKGGGKGAIDLLKILRPTWSIGNVCEELARLFPDRLGGIVQEVVTRRSPELWAGLSEADRVIEMPTGDLDVTSPEHSSPSPEQTPENEIET